VAHYTSAQSSRRRGASDRVPSRASFSRFLLLVFVVGAAMVAYRVYRAEPVDTDARHSTVEQPVGSTQTSHVAPSLPPSTRIRAAPG
jgi:hypothetical protein